MTDEIANIKQMLESGKRKNIVLAGVLMGGQGISPEDLGEFERLFICFKVVGTLFMYRYPGPIALWMDGTKCKSKGHFLRIIRLKTDSGVMRNIIPRHLVPANIFYGRGQYH